MPDDIPEALRKLRNYRERHMEVGKYFLTAYGGILYAMDVLAASVLDRSLSLLRGFCDLAEARNYVAAAPLLRVQLDNCLRFYASSCVEDPNAFFHRVLEGTPIRDLKDSEGNRMTDAYLVGKLSVQYPWIQTLYGEMSGYVHLSEKQFWHTWGISRDNRTKSGSFYVVTGDDKYISDKDYLKLIEAFRMTTEVVLDFLFSWGWCKEHPDDPRMNRAANPT